MDNIFLIYISIMTGLYIFDFVLSLRHCNIGYHGYPDEWDKPIQEKIHIILASIMWLAIFVFLGYFIILIIT